MTAVLRIARIMAAAMILAAATPDPFAHGHVPDAKRLLQLLSDRLGSADTLEVVQKLRIASTEGEGGMVDLSETVRYRFPENYRSDVKGNTIQRIFVEKEERFLTIIDDRVSIGVKTWFDRYKDLLFYRSAPLLRDHLNGWGMDTSITSLGRIDGTPVYVLGAQYPDKSASQLWIDKNSLLPMRWLVANHQKPSSGIYGEIHYLEWGKYGGIWYPLVIRFFQNNRLVREIRAEQVKSGDPIEEKWFDIDALHDRFTLSETGISPFQAIEEVRRIIKEFTGRFK